MLLGHQVSGDVTCVLRLETPAGRTGGLLNHELVSIIGAARVIGESKTSRKILLGVIFRTQIALFVGTIGTRALAWVVNPPDNVIVIVLFADAA